MLFDCQICSLGRWMGWLFYKTSQSPSIKQLSGLSFINDQNTSRIQLRLARCFIRQKQTTEVRGSNPNKSVFQFSLGCIFLKFIYAQLPGSIQNPLKNRSASWLWYAKKIARTYFALDIYPLKNQSTSQLHYVKIITVRAPARGRSHAQCGGSNLT